MTKPDTGGRGEGRATLIIRHVNGAVVDRYEVFHIEADKVLAKFPYNSELQRGDAYAKADAARAALQAQGDER